MAHLSAPLQRDPCVAMPAVSWFGPLYQMTNSEVGINSTCCSFTAPIQERERERERGKSCQKNTSTKIYAWCRFFRFWYIPINQISFLWWLFYYPSCFGPLTANTIISVSILASTIWHCYYKRMRNEISKNVCFSSKANMFIKHFNIHQKIPLHRIQEFFLNES